MGTWNPVSDSPINLSAATAILVCAVLASFTHVGWGPNVVIGVVILELGVLGTWMLDKRRPVAEKPAST